MIEATGLGKTFHHGKGKLDALDDVHLSCRSGSVYALLGPNGAGKTTALRILSTLMAPSRGEARVCGFSVTDDPLEVRRRIGVVSYETKVYERMTPREIATFFGQLNGMSRGAIRGNVDRLGEMLGMADILDRRTDSFSTGMLQKTVLLRALVTDPEVLLFDEPTSGLDLFAAKGVLDHIRLLRSQGKTILFSTHVLWEAERLADVVGILLGGRLICQGTLDELRARTGSSDLEDIFFHLASPERLAATA